MPEYLFAGKIRTCGVAALGGPVVASSRPFPVCGAPMPGRKTSVCSDRCRAAKSRLARLPLPMTETRNMNAQLTTILETAREIKATLERCNR